MFGIKSKIFSLIKSELGPEKLMLSPIGYECNNNCLMCWRNNVSPSEIKEILDSGTLDINVYRKMINKLPSTVKTIEIQGGGEPLLYHDIDKLFKIIKEKKYIGGLITNGVLLDKHTKLLVELNWDYIRISINSINGDIYKRVNGVDNFNLIVNNISKINKLRNKNKTKIILHYVIQKANFEYINTIFDLAKKIDVDEISFDYVLAFDKNRDKLVLSNKELNSLKRKIKTISKKTEICRNNLDRILEMMSIHPFWKNLISNNSYLDHHKCTIINNILHVLSDGTCIPCCLADKKFFNLNIKDKDIGTIWRKYRKYRRDISNGRYMSFCKKYCNYKID